MSAKIPGNWQVCSSGNYPPSRAVQSPDSYNSYVALWDFDYTIGRACVLDPSKGIDAWFPHGGVEHSAGQKNFPFRVLLDDSSKPFEWVRALEVMDRQSYTPFMIQGYVPLVLMNVCGGLNLLGKGTLTLMQAWVSYGGREQSFQGDIVTNAMVLCQRATSRFASSSARREVQINSIPRIHPNNVKTITLGRVEKTFNNTSEQPMDVCVQLNYERREGQMWQFDVPEHSQVRTVIDAHAVVNALKQGDHALGFALYGQNTQEIERTKTSLTKSFTIPPRTQRNVRVSVQCQEMSLRCTATEITYDNDGRVLLQRQTPGTWSGATSKLQTSELVDTPARIW